MSASKPNRVTVELVNEPIVVGQYESKLCDPDVGAHGWFLGVTRRTTITEEETTTTETLFYEAKESMAMTGLREIAQQSIAQFGLFHVVLIHRLGEVPIGQASVLVGCCSPHRRQTFEAIPWIMDRLKSDVPIWKREHYLDGQTAWVHPGLKT